MESLAHWLHRLSKIEPSDVERTVLRVFVPGHSVMNFDQWLMTTEQPCRVPPGFRSPFPESVAVLAFLEDKRFSRNAPHQHRLSADIAAAMSLALERRIEIPYEISVRVDGSPTMSFLPYTGIADHTTGGPLPPDAKSLVGDVFSKISGLPDDDLAVIGAATSMLHGAIMLSGEDIRSAYTLLVAGVETLSRKYGAPPTNWDAWELSESWDNFVADFGLSPSQTQGLRDRLMNNVQLRLKATFRSYASSRLRPTFWGSRLG